VTLAVAFLPDTPLLVPGVAGRADPLADLRTGALTALAPRDDAEAASPVLVLAPGRADRTVHGARASFGAIGVPAHLVSPHGGARRVDPVPPGPGAAGAASTGAVPVGSAPTGPVPNDRAPRDLPLEVRAPADAPASVALALLAAAGRTGPVRVAEIDRTTTDVTALRERGRALAAALPAGTLVVVVGSLSARDGEEAPLAADPRADVVDDALLAALAAGPAALAAVLDDRGDDLRPGPGGLAVSGWAPWRVLLGALAGLDGLDGLGEPGGLGGPFPAEARVLARTTGSALGAHAVAVWRSDRAPIPDRFAGRDRHGLPDGRTDAPDHPTGTTPEEHR
jgi:hypothetical protein